jgi:hypothetical protein
MLFSYLSAFQDERAFLLFLSVTEALMMEA